MGIWGLGDFGTFVAFVGEGELGTTSWEDFYGEHASGDRKRRHGQTAKLPLIPQDPNSQTSKPPNSQLSKPPNFKSLKIQAYNLPNLQNVQFGKSELMIFCIIYKYVYLPSFSMKQFVTLTVHVSKPPNSKEFESFAAETLCF